MRLRFRNEALNDLEEIGDYIAADNPLRAESFVAELRAHCERLLPNPRMHPVRRSLPGNVRIAPHGGYLIIYLTPELRWLLPARRLTAKPRCLRRSSDRIL